MKDLNNLLRDIANIEIYIDAGMLNNIFDVIHEKAANPIYVTDSNIYDIIPRCIRNLDKYIILPKGCLPSITIINALRDKIKDYDLVVAIGSGTINDICKCASYFANKKYVTFPSAPSMNGYVSKNASIIENNLKKSILAHTPDCVYVDVDFVTNAPIRMIKAGLGDSICRTTSRADWLLSKFLIKSNYSERPFEILRETEVKLLNNIKSVLSRDKEAVMLLMEVLLLSGIGMVMCDGSYPASQGEHIIAHALSMSGSISSNFLHGEIIAVTSLTMCKIQEYFLNLSNPPVLSCSTLSNNSLISMFHRNDSAEFIKIFSKKMLTKDNIEEMNQRIELIWSELVSEISKDFLSYNDMCRHLSTIDTFMSCDDLGIKKDRYLDVVKIACATRDRFTFLDVVCAYKEDLLASSFS